MLEFIRCGDLLSFYIMARTVAVQDVLLARTARVQDVVSFFFGYRTKTLPCYIEYLVVLQKYKIILRSLFYILNYIATVVGTYIVFYYFLSPIVER